MKSTEIKFEVKSPEILAPAGTVDAMKAAVNAGCDAVYLGGNLFSARAFAGNFDRETMVETIDYCHLFGVKVYMTVNTLLKDDEMAALTEYMKPFYHAGLDGVIIQDAGVLRCLHAAYPDLPLHASTQMSVSSVYGAEFLKNLGLTRIVPARELTLEEIRTIRENVDIEIESFVHGAMCYAYSGKCLFSSYMGGRSGNRGRCAQPCRQCYEILTDRPAGAGKDSRQENISEYIMSLKDMCTLKVLPQLIDAGIDSFKIEGRMKNPYYVAATVNAYRQATDLYVQLRGRYSAKGQTAVWKELSDTEQQQYLVMADRLTDDMRDIYNRGGFSTGYYFTDIKNEPGEMLANKRPNHQGLLIGQVRKVSGPDIQIGLFKDMNEQDVLEIDGIEVTSARSGRAGETVSIKGRELRKIRPGMKVFRTRNNRLLRAIEDGIISVEKKIYAQALIRARKGQPLSIEIREDRGITEAASAADSNCLGGTERTHAADFKDISVCVQGKTIEEAGSRPSDVQTLLDKIRKTGGTNVELSAECEIDDNVFVPMSEFNALRREAVEEYKKALSGQYHRS